MEKRSHWFYIGLFLAFTGVLGRLFALSMGSNAAVAEAAVNNRSGRVTLYRTKGLIYDENLQPLAGAQPCTYLVIDPRRFPRSEISALVRSTGAEEARVREKLKNETPFVLQCQAEPIRAEGVYAFRGSARYSGVAQHLLGYLDGNGEVGLAGAEKEYNDYLSLFSAEAQAVYYADARRGAVPDMGFRAEQPEETKNGVVLTLNQSLCAALEEAMDRYVEVGAAVVLDCASGELKAAASRPGYDEACIADYLESDRGELVNRAFAAETVGSVFKIILAVCAVELGLESFSYTCTGAIAVQDHVFACHNHAGHGALDLREAFAQSCNAYFIALGQMIGYEQIAETAARFGFGERIPVQGAQSASGGTFPGYENSAALANLSIGQGKLTASPLQIARMTAVIANGGYLPEIALYKGLYLGGKIKAPREEAEQPRIITAECAEALRALCVYTVEEGTGQSARPARGGAGGKTASAQTGALENGVEKLNVYFSGFYPADLPRYAITVFAENGESGGKTCAPVFREICDFMAENGLTP